MNKDTLRYDNGELICEYKNDRQIIYYGAGERAEYLMEGDKFTRDALYYNNDFLYAKMVIERHDDTTGIAEGVYYYREDQGDFIAVHKVTLNYDVLTETTHDDMDGNGITQIIKIDPENHATILCKQYHESRHLLSIQRYKDNLPHGYWLKFYDRPDYIPKNKVSDERAFLLEFKHYEMGVLAKNEIYDDRGSVLWSVTGDKSNRLKANYKSYSYLDHDNYLVQYSDQDHVYQQDTFNGKLLLEQIKINKDQRITSMQFNKYEPISQTIVLTKSKQIIPTQWDKDGKAISGLVKRSKAGNLDSVVPFIKKDNRFIYHGLRIFKEDKVTLYKAGKEIKTYAAKVFEKNGELIIQKNSPSLTEEKDSANPTPTGP